MRHSTQNAGDHTQLTSVRRLFTGLNTLKDMSVHHNSQLTAKRKQQLKPQLTPVRWLFTGVDADDFHAGIVRCRD